MLWHLALCCGAVFANYGILPQNRLTDAKRRLMPNHTPTIACGQELFRAAQRGNLLALLHVRPAYISAQDQQRALCVAAANDHVEAFKLLKSKFWDIWDMEAMPTLASIHAICCVAAHHGNVGILQELLPLRMLRYEVTTLLNHAVANAPLASIKWMIRNDWLDFSQRGRVPVHVRSEALDYAVQYRSIAVVRALLKNHIMPDKASLLSAVCAPTSRKFTLLQSSRNCFLDYNSWAAILREAAAHGTAKTISLVMSCTRCDARALSEPLQACASRFPYEDVKPHLRAFADNAPLDAVLSSLTSLNQNEALDTVVSYLLDKDACPKDPKDPKDRDSGTKDPKDPKDRDSGTKDPKDRDSGTKDRDSGTKDRDACPKDRDACPSAIGKRLLSDARLLRKIAACATPATVVRCALAVQTAREAAQAEAARIQAEQAAQAEAARIQAEQDEAARTRAEQAEQAEQAEGQERDVQTAPRLQEVQDEQQADALPRKRGRLQEVQDEQQVNAVPRNRGQGCVLS